MSPRKAALEASSSPGTRDAAHSPTDTGTPSGCEWAASSREALRWIGAGGVPNTLREDLLRDVVAGWRRLHPDHAAWDVAGTMLAASTTLADRAPCGGAAAVSAAMTDLAAAIEDCVHAGPDAPGRARQALERFLTLLPPPPDPADAAP